LRRRREACFFGCDLHDAKVMNGSSPASVSSLVAGRTITGLAADTIDAVSGDFNGDGKMDVAIMNNTEQTNTPNAPNTLTVLLSNGAGSWHLSTELRF